MSDTIADLEASFMRALRADDRAPATLRGYGNTIASFTGWLADNGKPATLDELTRGNIRGWLAYLFTVRKATSVATRFAGLKRFCGWLVAEGELDEHPMAGLRRAEPPHAPVPVLADSDLTALLKTTAGRGFEQIRDTMVVRLLLDSGIRVSELCGLTLESVDLDNSAALVLGKGRKPRMVYFGAKTTQAVDRYMRERRRHPKAAQTDALVIGARGPFTTDGVRKRLALLGQRAGLKGRSNPHRFRHTFAHDFLLAGGQERDLKRLAGWSSDVMLERYGSSAADLRAQEAVRRMRRGDRV